MEQFIFILDSPFLVTAVREAETLAEVTIIESEKKGAVPPPKFDLCLQAARNMQAMQPVTKEQFNGLIDSIGGYYSASVLYYEKYGGDLEAVKHAEEMMRFAKLLLEKVQPIWGLELVKPQGGEG